MQAWADMGEAEKEAEAAEAAAVAMMLKAGAYTRPLFGSS